RAKHGLAVQLASDPDQAVANAYGVWKEKSMYGRKYMGIERTTFLFGPDGRIVEIWEKVKVTGHAEAVLKAAGG
ncbi:MAG: redoxin domain-containing protein, partial [Ancalomicrobiaceae bacterium]|nr:redoxin domain-containing protein [Ancalomicrobiaceae bacterium]